MKQAYCPCGGLLVPYNATKRRCVACGYIDS